MNWLEIVGAIGGSAGVVALIKAGIDVYKAKSGKTSVDLDNMNKILQEAIARHDKLEARFDEFQGKAHGYVQELRGMIVARDAQINNLEGRINDLERVVNVAWRCKYPENVDDCPVIQEYEKKRVCEGCGNREAKNEQGDI